MLQNQGCSISPQNLFDFNYLGDEVPLFCHRDKLNALTDIANHPKLSKRMRSL
jgi:hypothetical protein